MRFWANDKGDILTDDQVLAYVAHAGSLSEAAERGDVRLVAGDPDEERRPYEGREGVEREHARLAHWLDLE